MRRKQEPASGQARIAEERAQYGDASNEDEVRLETISLLRDQIAAMNVNNFVVRPRRRAVERFARPEAWSELNEDAYRELSQDVAGLPTELPEEDEESKRFDLLMLRIEIAVLRGDRNFQKLRDQVRNIAILLESQSSIPMINEQLALIQEIQSSEYWQDATVPMLEVIRKRLRNLIKLIEKARRQPVYTDFEDEMGVEV